MKESSGLLDSHDYETIYGASVNFSGHVNNTQRAILLDLIPITAHWLLHRRMEKLEAVLIRYAALMTGEIHPQNVVTWTT